MNINIKNITWGIFTAYIFSTSVTFAAPEKLNYEALRKLNNPYFAKARDSALKQGTEEYISVKALEQRFDLCKQPGLLHFIAMANHAPIATEAGLSKKKIFSRRSKLLGIDYPFASTDLSPEEHISQLALKLGWNNQGQNPDKIASEFWGVCTMLPISIFENYWRED